MIWAHRELDIDIKKGVPIHSAISFEITKLRLDVKKLKIALAIKGITSDHLESTMLNYGVRAEMILHRVHLSAITLFLPCIAKKPRERGYLLEIVFREHIHCGAMDEAEKMAEEIKPALYQNDPYSWWMGFGVRLFNCYCEKNELEKALKCFESGSHVLEFRDSHNSAALALLKACVKVERWDLYSALLEKCPASFVDNHLTWFLVTFISYNHEHKAIELLNAKKEKVICAIVADIISRDLVFESINKLLQLMFQQELLDALELELVKFITNIDKNDKYKRMRLNYLIHNLLLCEWPGEDAKRRSLIDKSIETKFLTSTTLIEILKQGWN